MTAASTTRFFVTLPQFPFQQGSSLNASDIDDNWLQAMERLG
jgi:hypothetical protein